MGWDELLESLEIRHRNEACSDNCPFCEADRRGISVYKVIEEQED